MKRSDFVWQPMELPAVGVIVGRLNSGAVVLVLGCGRRELSIRLKKGRGK